MLDRRQQLTQAFAQRLVHLLKEKGFTSAHAASGVRVTELAQVNECSVQMARKYVLGLAFPDYPVLEKMAAWLGVTSGWLAFGEVADIPSQYLHPDFINIDKKNVDYILKAIFSLFLEKNNTNELVSFISDIMRDVSHLKADDATIKKMIDMAVSSAARFKAPQQMSAEKKE